MFKVSLYWLICLFCFGLFYDFLGVGGGVTFFFSPTSSSAEALLSLRFSLGHSHHTSGFLLPSSPAESSLQGV